MRLIPALGSADMQRAISDSHVHALVEILLQVTDLDIFAAIALFLKNHDQRILPAFAEELRALRRNLQSKPDNEGNFPDPSIDSIIEALEAFYNQHYESIRFQRGAIIEVLALELVWERCDDEECFGNYRFIDDQSRYKSDQVDVAVLSQKRKEIEGYACKMKAVGIESADCTNLTTLKEKAQERGFTSHVGVVSFDNTTIIRRRLEKFPSTRSITTYGINNIHELSENPFEQ